MIEEQEAVRGRLFTIQDVMQSTVRAWLQVSTCYTTISVVVERDSEPKNFSVPSTSYWYRITEISIM